jgi:hypothetical protein
MNLAASFASPRFETKSVEPMMDRIVSVGSRPVQDYAVVVPAKSKTYVVI